MPRCAIRQVDHAGLVSRPRRFEHLVDLVADQLVASQEGVGEGFHQVRALLEDAGDMISGTVEDGVHLPPGFLVGEYPTDDVRGPHTLHRVEGYQVLAMPKLPTIWAAASVAVRRSPETPLLVSPMNSSSATIPPMAMRMSASISDLVRVHLSSGSERAKRPSVELLFT